MAYKRFLSHLRAGIVATLFAVSIVNAALPALTQAAGTITLGGVSSLSGLRGVPISLNGLTISGSGTTSIQLRASHGEIALTDTSGVTVNGTNPSSVLSYSGTVANITASFAHLQYTATNAGSDTIEVSTVGEGQVYYPGNGHVYQVIDYDMDPGDGAHGIDWDTSHAQAATKNYQGLTGYLATITSAEENDYVSARLGDAGWMGASDSGTEGDWKWVGGPESGTSFWNGDSSGTVVGSNYSNWGDGEPNNAGDEDCTQFLSGGTGKWNDLPCAGTYLPAYVVEFGADGSLPDVARKNIAVTVTAPTHTVSSCQELTDLSSDPDKRYDKIVLNQDIDCQGATVEPIFKQDGFNGEFDGQGHSIRNFNIDAMNGSYGQYGPAGLFMHTDGAIIKNLNIEGGTVSGYEHIGALIGNALNTSVQNVTSAMNVSAQGSYVGGLIGYVEVDEPNLTISGSSATGTVNGSNYVGGLIGQLYAGSDGNIEIYKSFTTGDVVGDGSMIGGLFGAIGAEGWDDPETVVDVHDVYAQGDVSTSGVGDGNIGGLIGNVQIYQDGAPTSFSLRNAYASGNVEGDFNVGGLIGILNGADYDVSVEVSTSFAAGLVESLDPTTGGALVGYYNEGSEPITWSENYFDQTRGGLSDCFGSAGQIAGNCNARNIADAQPSYFFKRINNPMPDWNFSTIWVAHADTWPTFAGQNVDDNNPVAPGVQDDSDGVSAEVEQAAPNGGDANNDGTADSQQAYVTSFVNPVTSKYVSLAISTTCSTTEAGVASEASKPTQDSGYNYPSGLLNFSATCGSAGFTATINQYYYGASTNSLTARKYNPVTHAYFTIPDSSVSKIAIGGQMVTKISYQVTDGGMLDVDAIANGTIVDPAGPAESVAATPNTGVRSLQDLLFKHEATL